MEFVIHSLLHAAKDCLKMLPFLFIAYLLMEILENSTSHKAEHAIKKAGVFGPFIGAVLGAVPQCGFSVAAANLYSGRIVSIGVLAAVFISTSDEAVPILLANPKHFGKILLLIATKVVLGIIAGYLFEFLFTKTPLEKLAKPVVEDVHGHEHESCHSCKHSHGKMWKSVVLHTLSTWLFIFAITAGLNMIIEAVGLEGTKTIFLGNSIFQPVVAALIGFIPNCASSVFLTGLYAEGALSFGSVIAGLCTGAGVGMLVLFKANKSVKQNLTIAGLLYAFSCVVGVILHIIGI